MRSSHPVQKLFEHVVSHDLLDHSIALLDWHHVGPSEAFDALAAAIATATEDLAANAAALQALGSPSTTTIDDVQAIAGRMRLGSLGPLVRVNPKSQSQLSTLTAMHADACCR